MANQISGGVRLKRVLQEANSGNGSEHKWGSPGKTELPHTGCLLTGH